MEANSKQDKANSDMKLELEKIKADHKAEVLSIQEINEETTSLAKSERKALVEKISICNRKMSDYESEIEDLKKEHDSFIKDLRKKIESDTKEALDKGSSAE